MEMVNKVESLIFNQVLNQPSLQLIKNKIVTINHHCLVKQFTEDTCLISTPEGRYRLTGKNLRVKEYGDCFIRIESDGIEKIEVMQEEDEHE